MARHQVAFANAIIRAGEKELLDVFEELVWPALTDKQLVRTYGESRFFIDDYRGFVVEWNGTPQVLAVARIVKTTMLKREQYYDRQKGLVEDARELESAPSGILVLILNSHKLVYFHETTHAPPLAQVEKVLEQFIHKKHEQAIRTRFAELRWQGKTVTLGRLRAEFPRPTVEIIPLSSETSLSDFIDTFDVLKSIEVRLVKPNSEIDLNPFFQMAREEQERLRSTQTTIKQKNKEGLKSAEAKPYLRAATKQGNARVKLDGLDQRGDKISGDNTNFSIKTFVDKVPKYLRSAGKSLFAEFMRLVDDERIPLTAETKESARRSIEIARNLGWLKDGSKKDGDDEPAD